MGNLNFIRIFNSKTPKSKMGNLSKADIELELKYQKIKSTIISYLGKIAKNARDFWEELSKKHKELNTLGKCIININKLIIPLKELYQDYIKTKYNDTKTLLIMENFLRSVLNDDKGSDDIIAKLSFQHSENYSNSESESLLNEYENYIKDGSGYLLISGDEKNIGKIISYNPSFAKMFHYNNEELNGKDFTILIPEIFRKSYDKQIQLKLKQNNNEDKKKNYNYNFIMKRSGVGLNKAGYIFPINFTTKMIYSIDDSINYISLFRKPPSDNFKVYPIYFLTDLNFFVKNISSSAIPIFGINSNNISSKNETLNLSLFINEISLLKEDKLYLKEFQETNTLEPKKQIKISDDEIKRLKNFLDKIAENNKSVKIVEKNLIVNANTNYETIFTANPLEFEHDTITEYNNVIRIKNFYISINEVVLFSSILGFLLKLEPIRSKNFLIDTKNIITYEENIVIFNPKTFKFVSQDQFYDENGTVTQNLKKGTIVSNIDSLNIFTPRVRKKNKKRKSKEELTSISMNHTNLIQYLYKKKNIKNYADIQKVKTIFRIQGHQEKEVLPPKETRLDEQIKNINIIFKKNFNENDIEFIKNLDNDENEQNIDQQMEERALNNLLNFKGIEGWFNNYQKISKTKYSKKILIFAVLIIILSIAKIVLMFFRFFRNKSLINVLKSAQKLKILTLRQIFYFLECVHYTEIMNEFKNNSNYINDFNFVNNSIISMIEIINNITSNIKLIKGINNYFPYFEKNLNYTLINNNNSFSPTIELTLLGIIMNLTNRLYSIVGDRINFSLNYNLFLTNTLNIYITSAFQVSDQINYILEKKINKIKQDNYLFIFIGFILIFDFAINIIYEFIVSSKKNSLLNLYFNIPERIIWKYQTNCEEFLSLFYKDDFDNSKINKKPPEENLENYQNNHNFTSTSVILTDNKNSKDSKQQNQKINISKNKELNRNTFIVKILIFHIFVLIFGYSYLIIFYKEKFLLDSNFLITNNCYLAYEMDLYLISQYQLFQNSTIYILNIKNDKFQEEYSLTLLNKYNIFLDFWYRHGTKLFGKGKFDTKNYFKNNSISKYDIYEIMSKGACDILNEYDEICEIIPFNSRGYLDCGIYLIDNMTNYYIDYQINNITKNFSDNDYYNMVMINIIYFSSLTRGIIHQLNIVINDNLNNMKNKYILLFVLYLIIILGKIVVYFGIVQKNSLFELIYIKTTLLLINPNDIKENRIIMDFLHKEMLLTN